MTLAHIRAGAVLKRFTNPAKITLEDGRRVHSPAEGFVDGNDKVVPIETVETGVPAGPDVITTRAETVEADRVLITIDRRAMTAQEITDRDTAQADAVEAQVFTNDPQWVATMMTLRDALKAVRDGNLAGATDAQITNVLKTRFRANYESLL